MSILDAVREKYKTPMHGTDKTDKRASVGFVSPTNSQNRSFCADNLRLLAGSDWPEISTDPEQLAAFKAAAETVEQIQQGIIPDHYTATTECGHCGPVPIFPGLPAKVDGCPWCFNRLKGLPMPAC